ncbi:hypothetical protein B447_00295 [Thauera sp. 27]|uniref:pilus assembly PilX family protein n=1 Tax=Thauera sp. 27 TaxID=305700 RepID=UPI0002D1121C|nr:PilX N-terminal domain-containing pilus assembly protein [Thauera sp. 27]ENO83186.1 hypothetical protein B447_00295 [Thauera sp. 27]
MVLMIGMIFMLIMTLVTVASMRTTTLEERMAGNARDNDLAFQAAEAALRVGEMRAAELASMDKESDLPSDSGEARRDERYWTNTNTSHQHNWATDATPVASALAGLAEAPRYVIEDLPPLPPDSEKFGASGSRIFRISARGVGGNPSTVVYLQSTYHP